MLQQIDLELTEEIEWNEPNFAYHIAGRMKCDLVQIRFLQTDTDAKQSSDGVPRFPGHKDVFRLGEFHFPGIVLLLKSSLCSFATVEEIIGLIVVQDQRFARSCITIGDHLEIDARG